MISKWHTITLVWMITILSWANADTTTCSSVGLMVECQVSLDVLPSEAVKFLWERADGTGRTVSQFINFTSTYEYVQLFRFAPYTEYIIEVVPFGSPAMQVSVTTGSTGNSQFDTAALASISGTPTFSLLFMDLGTAYAMIDETGWIVWYYDTQGTLPSEPAQAKGQLPNNDFIFLKNGFIQQVKPNSTEVAYATRYCNPESTSYENHECRPTVDGTRVYSLQETVKNETVEWGAPTSSILGQLINYWDPETGNYTNLYSSFEIWNSTVDASTASKGVLTVECLENPSNNYRVTDWSHCNSVSEGPFDNIIISSRELSSIVSARNDGSGIDWMIATEIASDYTFPNTTDKFYNQHDVQELSNGNLIMIDNGADRPTSVGVFTRAAEYVVDHDAKTVELIWEFYPFVDGVAIDCFHGGSVTIMEDDRRLISFPCDGNTGLCNMAVYETSGDETVATIVVNVSSSHLGGYRVEPWLTINGEE